MGRQTRHSKTNTAFTTCTSRQTRSSNLTIASTTTGSSSTVSSDKVINLKPVKTEVVVPHRSSGGRHLQPPIGNDAKLKHKVRKEECACIHLILYILSLYAILCVATDEDTLNVIF